MQFEFEVGESAYIFDKAAIASNRNRSMYPWLKTGDGRMDEAEENGPLCWVCRALNFDYLFAVPTADMVIPADNVPENVPTPVSLWGGLCLGPVRDLHDKSFCRFCSFVLGSLRRLSAAPHDPLAICAVQPNTRVYLRGLIRGTTLSFRRTQPAEKPQENAPVHLFIYLRNERESLKSSPLLRPIQRVGAAEELPAAVGIASGRLVPGDEAGLGVIRRWISACRGAAPQPRPAPPSIRLIDIFKGSVTDTFDEPPEYVALSYVWGNAKNLTLTAQTAAALQTPGTITADNPDMPLTIRDAILACQVLSLPYLWIDSLCIEQDSPLKMATIGQMDTIYGCARLTLVAAAGSDAQAGLPGVRAGTRPRRQRAIRIDKSVLLAEVLPTFKAVVDKSIWNSRGWTYQERILSGSKLYFTDEQAYFECPHGYSCEDNLCGPHESDAALGHAADGVVIDDSPPGGVLDDKYQIEQKRILDYVIYEGVVREFTARTLSYEEDVEAAFQGVANALRLRIFNGSPVLFGIPLCYIDLALLWYPSGRLQRRRRRVEHGLGDPGHFPSWTWMGWKGKFLVESVGNKSERMLSRVEWLDARDRKSSLSKASTGMPPPSWPGWSQWTRHVDQHDFGFYTSNALESSTEKHFCHPVPACASGPPLPVDPVSGMLFMRAEIARMALSVQHTGRWDQESACADGDHVLATCQLWVLSDAGKRAGIAHVSGEWLLGKDTAAARSGLSFIKLSQQTFSLNESDPAWDGELCIYRGAPGSPAINPQEPLGPEDEVFDQAAYDQNICWCLYNVLLVEWVEGIAYRVGIGYVHIDAFDSASPEWMTVGLG
ncbi:hypothetical protein OQA88_4860 [Cercophora sp. LCS_1]